MRGCMPAAMSSPCLSGDRAWIFGMGQGVEVNAGPSEPYRKQSRIGTSHVPNCMQTELVKACLGLWARPPQPGHRKWSEPGFGFFRSNHSQPVRLLANACDFGHVFG